MCVEGFGMNEKLRPNEQHGKDPTKPELNLPSVPSVSGQQLVQLGW